MEWNEVPVLDVQKEGDAEKEARPLYRSDNGFLLPPGVIPLNTYLEAHGFPGPSEYLGFSERIRGIPGSKQQFILSEHAEDRLAFDRLLAEFHASTAAMIQETKQYLAERDVHVVLNGPSEKRLRAWQRVLPRFTVKLHPVFLSSQNTAHTPSDKKTSSNVSDCLIHIDGEGRLQYVRRHTNVDPEVLQRSRALGEWIFSDRTTVSSAFVDRDFEKLGKILGDGIASTLPKRSLRT
jgi:hypothetical protein